MPQLIRRKFLTLCTAIALFVLARSSTTRGDDVKPPPATTQATTTQPSDGPSSTLSAEHVTIPLSRGGPLLFVAVRINGVDAGLLGVDTGATYTTLDRGLADQLGLPKIFESKVNVLGGEAAMDLRAVDTLSVGDAGGANMATLKRLIISTVDLAAMNKELGTARIRGMIGSDVLRSWPLTIDWRLAQLTFYERGKFTPPPGVKRQVAYFPRGNPTVQMQLGPEISGWFSLDTGFNGEVNIATPSARLWMKTLRKTPWGSNKSIGPNGLHSSRHTVLPAGEIFGDNVAPVRVDYPADGGAGVAVSPGSAGAVGFGLLRRYRLTFDYGGGAVWAERAASDVPVEWERRDFDPKQPDVMKICPLAMASVWDRPDFVAKFLAAGADVNARDWRGCTALHDAARRASVGVVDALLKAGADTKLVSRLEETPLQMAAGSSRRDVVERLLAAGADVSASDAFGRTALIIAAEQGSTEVVDVLLKAKSDVKAVSASDGAAIHAAAAAGHADVVEMLLKAGADPDMPGGKTNYDFTPLIAACAEGHTEVVKVLLDHGARIEKPDSGGGRPLLQAAMFGNTECVRLLLERGADPGGADRKGRTPIQVAMRGGYIETVAALYYGVQNAR